MEQPTSTYSENLRARNPSISVVIPAYNAATHLPRAVRSVLSQTFTPLEIVITNDGSIDETSDIIRGFAAHKTSIPIRLLEQSNAGVGAARNLAMRAAHGEWLAFLDADDTWRDTKLQRVVDWIALHPEADLIYHGGEMVSIDGGRRGIRRHAIQQPVFENLLLGSNPISTSATVVRKELALRIGGFWERDMGKGADDLNGTEDYDFWLRLAREGAMFSYLPEVLETYYRVEGSLSMRINYHGDRALAVFRKHLEWLRENGRCPWFWFKYYVEKKFAQNHISRAAAFASRGDMGRAIKAQWIALGGAWWWWKPYANFVRLGFMNPIGMARQLGIRHVAGLAHLPFRWLGRTRSARRMAPCCLVYHDIPEDQRLLFAQQIESLSKHYTFVDYAKFVSRLENPDPEAGRELLLTFDDGFLSSYQASRDILAPRGIRAVFFVPTGFLDARTDQERLQYVREKIFRGRRDVSEDMDRFRPMSWEQVADLARTGHTIGAHTINHAYLSELPDSLLWSEIAECSTILVNRVGCDVQTFAVPFGTAASMNRTALIRIQETYQTAFTSVHGSNTDAPYHLLRRETIEPSDPPEYVKMMIEGGMHWRYRAAAENLGRLAHDLKGQL